MAYPSTNTNLDSTIKSSLSTQIIVYVNDEPVGAIQSMNIRQQRTIKEITEVGTDGIIEIIPASATKFSMQVTRIMFDGLSLPEAFSRGFTNINSQRMPFSIVVVDTSAGAVTDAIVTTYHNCYFESLSKRIQTQDYLITEDASVKCEFVTTRRNGGSVATTQGGGGGRSMNYDEDGVEIATDSGVGSLARRGSMDYPGIISAAFSE